MSRFLQDLARNPLQLVDRLDHMDRDSNGASLVRNRPANGLSDPPSRVRGELVPTAIFKSVDGPHQANIAFLYQIEKQQASVRVSLRNGDHQPQIRFDHFALRV